MRDDPAGSPSKLENIARTYADALLAHLTPVSGVGIAHQNPLIAAGATTINGGLPAGRWRASIWKPSVAS